MIDFEFSDAAVAHKPRVPRRKRADKIVDAIKDMIAGHGLEPGDRLPQERDLVQQFGAGKGTVREALKSLEVQGLIKVRTGPGGGAFIERMSEGRAMSMLSNFLFAKELSIAHIYAMRKVLEPIVAASAVDQINEAGLRRLTNVITTYDHEPRNEAERWNQRMAELDFHGIVAEYSDNPILAFTCRFLQRLLKELPVAKDIYADPAPVRRESGITHQRSLIEAMRRQDKAAAKAIVAAHMAEAENFMLDLEAKVVSRFIADDGAA